MRSHVGCLIQGRKRQVQQVLTPLLFDQKWVRGGGDRVLWWKEATVRMRNLVATSADLLLPQESLEDDRLLFLNDCCPGLSVESSRGGGIFRLSEKMLALVHG